MDQPLCQVVLALSEVIFYRVYLHEYFWLVSSFGVSDPLLEVSLYI